MILLTKQKIKTPLELEKEALRNKNVAYLCKYHFDIDLTPKQEEIVRTITFIEHKRISINAYTRYGKTFCVALGICLYIIYNKNKKIAIIAPQREQTDILREYIADLIIKSKRLQDLVELDKTRDVTSLKKEASRIRQTFRNGCEYRIFSAFREAYRLMGFGANLIVSDEMALISREASAKISRMLGDDPENAVLIELTNPWDRNTIAYEHWTDPSWHKIHIDYRIGLKEGRTTKAFIEEQRKELTPMEFRVLYESEYPEDPEDTLIRWEWIQKAIYDKLPNKLIGKNINGLDVAEMGIDLTVLTRAKLNKNKYFIYDIKSWAKQDTMQTTNNIANIINKRELINIDATGVGKGVYDRLNELNYNACEVKVGRGAKDKDRFANQKAEIYWALRKAFEEGRIKIPKNKDLIKQLHAMRYKLSASKKIQIIDPEGKSPDFSDSLALLFAEDNDELLFGSLDL